MARTVKDANLGTRTARQALAVRKAPYYRLICQGLHLGYYKGVRGGRWTARRFIGEHRYEETKLGVADDILDPDGVAVLSFAQAQERARAWFSERAKVDAGVEIECAPYTVAEAMDDYVRDYIRRGGKALGRLHDVINAHIRPPLGDIQLAKLTRRQLDAWQEALVTTPRRRRTGKGEEQKHWEPDNSLEAIRRRRASANRVLTVLKAALNLAHQHQKVSSSEAWWAVKPFREADAPKIRYLNEAEMKRLVNQRFSVWA